MEPFNSPIKAQSVGDDILHRLGSFYNSMDDDSRSVISNYFRSFLSGLEGLYYNLSEAINSYDLSSSPYFIDLSYNKILVDCTAGNKMPLEVPVIDSLVSSGSTALHVYSYTVTAVDNSGNETTASIVKAAKGPINLGVDEGSGLNQMILSWGVINNAVSYNIYGRDLIADDLKLIANTVSTTFNDLGTATTSSVPPSKNSTIGEIVVDIPLEYDILNISLIGNLIEGTDFWLVGTNKIKFKNIPVYLNFKETLELRYTYAFLPILYELYLKELSYPEDGRLVYYNKLYPHYIDTSSLSYGYNSNEKSNRAWSFHLSKLFHNFSLSSRKAITISSLEKMLSLIYNTPFAYTSGTVASLASSAGFHTFVIGNYSYKIPDTLSLSVINGSVVNKYDLLADAVTLEDMYTTGTSIVATDQFSQNKEVKFSIPSELQALGYSQAILDRFFSSIVPKHLNPTIIFT